MPNFGSITPHHFLTIPAVLVVGLWIGYSLGMRSARAEFERLARRMKE